ncbi:lasso peptide biosynthesis PqqD family chaperone [Neobacillus novalis]|uniref:Lasso peptide biosynthesis PqqD family chaperone n=1 Tax=Neobacillus novalis TaxID=220687 RepID=A0AA95SFI3_9BACI|nr:lasso peptide biosynthesis PqqD family chaperone [Neobacillus novalis]WHY85211.1 lasso peptide biosynthesis PqqD family chaperone [Neobacillus novalis]
MIKSGNISLGHSVKQIKGNIVSNMGGEKVMLSVKNGKYYNLGEIGGEIWDLIEEEISVNQLVAKLMSNFVVTKTECEKEVITFLELLLDESLIEIKDSL